MNFNQYLELGLSDIIANIYENLNSKDKKSFLYFLSSLDNLRVPKFAEFQYFCGDGISGLSKFIGKRDIKRLTLFDTAAFGGDFINKFAVICGEFISLEHLEIIGNFDLINLSNCRNDSIKTLLLAANSIDKCLCTPAGTILNMKHSPAAFVSLINKIISGFAALRELFMYDGTEGRISDVFQLNDIKISISSHKKKAEKDYNVLSFTDHTAFYCPSNAIFNGEDVEKNGGRVTIIPKQARGDFILRPKGLDNLKYSDMFAYGEAALLINAPGVFTNMKYLKLTSFDIKKLAHMPNLEKLVLRYCGNISDSSIDFSTMKKLKTLKMYNCCGSILNITAAEGLEELKLYGNKINIHNLNMNSGLRSIYFGTNADLVNFVQLPKNISCIQEAGHVRIVLENKIYDKKILAALGMEILPKSRDMSITEEKAAGFYMSYFIAEILPNPKAALFGDTT